MIDNSIDLTISEPYIPIIQNNNNKKIFGYRGGRGGGKSYGIADSIIIRCMQNNEKFFCGRVIKNANDISISSIFNSRLDNLFKQCKGLENFFKIKKDYIEYKNKEIESVIRFVGFGKDTIQNITSSEMSGCWVDECHNLTKETIDRLVPSVRYGKEQRIIFSYNPQLINDPVSVFLNSRKDAGVFDINFCDNPFFLQNQALLNEIKQDKIRLENKNITESEFNHRWFGKPYYENENLLFPYQLIEKTINFKSNTYLNYQKVMGVDVATDHGNDYSVIVIRQGNKIVDIVKLKGLDGLGLAQKIIEYKARYNVVSIFIDATGVGHSPCDFLKHNFNCSFTPVDFGRASEDERYDRLKTNIYYKLRKAIEDGLDIQLQDINGRIEIIDEIISELQYVPIVVLDNGKIRITKKTYIKEVLGHSPDILDAIAISYAFKTNDLKNDGLNHFNQYRTKKIKVNLN